LKVRANADTPEEARQAREFGAEGIGLCRTEHMFFAADRLKVMQEMIMAGTKEARQAALDKLLPMQRQDFLGIFREMAGFPVTIRTLDPPLHEFLPRREDIMVEIAKLEMTGSRPDVLEQRRKLLNRINALAEANPMLGHRGCRLGISHPEITLMQARAIGEAACRLKKEGRSVYPEIMVPLVGDAREFHHQWKLIVGVAKDVMKIYRTKVSYTVGTMIEIPRAALLAGEIAEAAEFFSFGTNDLTQTTYGFSRDDTGKFIDVYAREGIMPEDPFMSLDRNGVGQLMRMAVERGRKTRPGLKVGICGEHGGDPASIEFCHHLGLNYVSCSPFRVPTARLAAAQTAMGINTWGGERS
jgi:pyruvate,orthophosphate dikinase